jgi:hypothetical protein
MFTTAWLHLAHPRTLVISITITYVPSAPHFMPSAGVKKGKKR